ncbi:MAG TPA: HEAT repeat domain-containing protein, partial [Thermoanaerobaculia bacterium]|nr:HEAT repeat domain-containing protein [Thermoanaerobaculia bacterium]
MPRTPADEWQECIALVDALPQQELPQRAAAIEQLLRNPSAGIRQQALHLGSVVLPDEQLVDHLRNGSDDVLRNAGLEMLKLRGPQSIPVALALLDDADPDVVLQAILILDHIRDWQSVDALAALLKSADTNIVQAAITALGHIGNARIADELLPFLHGDPWLQFAAIRAVGDLRATSTLPTLQRLIPDSFVGPIAVEAIGRIGGGSALQILHRHWTECVEHLGIDEVLGLVADVAEALPHVDGRTAGLRDLLRPFLDDSQRRALVAARALLSLGAGESDAAAVTALIASSDSPALPRCFRSRKDLLNRCLTDPRFPRSWSFEMLSLWPLAAHAQAVDSVLRSIEEHDVDAALASTLVMLRSHDVAPALLSLYVRLPPEKRRLLLPALQNQRRSLMALIGSWPLDAPTRLVLVAVLGHSKTFVDDLLRLERNERLQVLFEIADHRKLMSLVP